MSATIHANYWANNSLKPIHQKKLDIIDLTKLSGLRSSVADFVYILTGKRIPVDFSSGKTSFTDSSMVVISAAMDEFKWDAIIGLALHEAAHIKYTDFRWLRKWTRNPKTFIPDDIYTLALAKGYDEEKVKEFVKNMENYLEDLIIDYLVYKKAPGYRPYYKAMYDSDWHSPKIDEYLQNNPVWRIPYYSSYFAQIVSSTNRHSDPTALPGLDKIVALIDYKHIDRFTERPKWKKVEATKLPPTFMIVLEMARIVFTNCLTKEQEDKMEEELEKARKGEPSNLPFPNYDTKLMLQKLTKEQLMEMLKNAKEITEKQANFLGGNVIKIQLSADDMKNLESINAKNASLKKAGPEMPPSPSTGKVPKEMVSVLLSVDSNLVESQIFPFRNQYGTVSDLTPGKMNGNVLANKLQIANEEKIIRYTRKTSGRIYQRHLFMAGVGADNLFYVDERKDYDPIRIHISLDASGSMAEASKWSAAINLVTSMIIVSKKIQGIHLTVDLRGSFEGNSGSCVAVVFDSKVDNLTKLETVIAKLSPAGLTPEGLCFEAIKDYIIKTSPPQAVKIFLNISDGMPYKKVYDVDAVGGYNYQGDIAYSHTAEQIHDFKEIGIQTISYFISSGDSIYSQDGTAETGFIKMYGRDAKMLDVSNMNLIATSLNKMFMQTLTDT